MHSNPPTAIQQGVLPAWLRLDPDPDPVVVPQHPMAIWVHRLFWLFMMSFSLDYRASDPSGGTGGGLDQMVFLMLWAVSTGCIFLLGWRYLTVRPGAWLIGLWGLFLAYMAANAVLQHVVPAHWFRMILPLLFLFAGLMNTHIAGCMGIRPSQLILPVLAAACTNILWRIFHGLVFSGLDFNTVRIEVQSAAAGWLSAWICCAIFLRGRFRISLLVACGVLFIGIFITVTRSLLFPIFAGSVASGFCFLLGIRWRIFDWGDLGRRLLPVAGVAAFGIGLIGLVAVAQPEKFETWVQRLFHNSDERNMPHDISYLTRKAEADAIWKTLTVEPEHLINGRGIGASYNWDQSYMPEISLMIPIDGELGADVWAIGHSTWTYSLFAGGIIAFLTFAALLTTTIGLSIRAAYANSSDPGPDQWLAFLPFIATICSLSETLTSNPFNDRLACIIYGVMAGLSQAFLVRASWIHMSPQSRFDER